MSRNAGIASRHVQVLACKFDDMLQDSAVISATARISLWPFYLLEKFRLLRIGKHKVEPTQRREP
jgi:hypothetical protein